LWCWFYLFHLRRNGLIEGGATLRFLNTKPSVVDDDCCILGATLLDTGAMALVSLGATREGGGRSGAITTLDEGVPIFFLLLFFY